MGLCMLARACWDPVLLPTACDLLPVRRSGRATPPPAAEARERHSHSPHVRWQTQKAKTRKMTRILTWLIKPRYASTTLCNNHNEQANFPPPSTPRAMPKIRTSRTKPPPEGYEDIQYVSVVPGAAGAGVARARWAQLTLALLPPSRKQPCSRADSPGMSSRTMTRRCAMLRATRTRASARSSRLGKFAA